MDPADSSSSMLTSASDCGCWGVGMAAGTDLKAEYRDGRMGDPMTVSAAARATLFRWDGEREAWRPWLARLPTDHARGRWALSEWTGVPAAADGATTPADEERTGNGLTASASSKSASMSAGAAMGAGRQGERAALMRL
jgi:hypothetical protein